MRLDGNQFHNKFENKSFCLTSSTTQFIWQTLSKKLDCYKKKNLNSILS